MTVPVNTGTVQSDIGNDTAALTIDDLARESGVASRTIREYQALRLLAPPHRVGRRGLYDATHRERLATIGHLQHRGYSLAAIRDLLTAHEQGTSVAGLIGTADQPGFMLDETPVSFTPAQFEAAAPWLHDSEHRSAAARAGLIVEHDGRVLVRSPALLAVAGASVAAGSSPAGAIALAATMRAGAHEQAEAAVQLFIEELWPARGSNAATASFARAARIALAQAASSLLVDELGAALARAAQTETGAGIGALVEAVRVGVVRVEADDPQ